MEEGERVGEGAVWCSSVQCSKVQVSAKFRGSAVGADRKARTGNTKGGSITVPLTSCLTGLD